MSTDTPTGYENEPVENFHPLPADLYCRFYDIEMNRKFEDCHYYDRLLRDCRARTVLELGCGTGRITEYLRARKYTAYGIDNSHDMLLHNYHRRITPALEMDMCYLGFKPVFDTILVPHNTLNLLGRRNSIRRCLSEMKTALAPQGLIVLHLFSVTDDLVKQAHTRIFQFALFDTPEGKLVKETIRIYRPESDQLLLEERYKIRSFTNPAHNHNYKQVFPLSVLHSDEWVEIIKKSGFTIHSIHSGFNQEVFRSHAHSTMLVTAQSL